MKKLSQNKKQEILLKVLEQYLVWPLLKVIQESMNYLKIWEENILTQILIQIYQIQVQVQG